MYFKTYKARKYEALHKIRNLRKTLSTKERNYFDGKRVSHLIVRLFPKTVLAETGEKRINGRQFQFRCDKTGEAARTICPHLPSLYKACSNGKVVHGTQ